MHRKRCENTGDESNGSGEKEMGSVRDCVRQNNRAKIPV